MMEHASIPQLALEALIAALQFATLIFAKRAHSEMRDTRTEIRNTLHPPPVPKDAPP